MRRNNRPRCSLAAFLGAVALICAWLAYHVDWIRQRHAYQNSFLSEGWDIGSDDCDHYQLASESQPAPHRLPFGLRVLGEQPVCYFSAVGLSDAEAARLGRLFPEAAAEWAGVSHQIP